MGEKTHLRGQDFCFYYVYNKFFWTQNLEHQKDWGAWGIAPRAHGAEPNVSE